MANALTAVIGADSRPFANEMNNVERIAKRSSQHISMQSKMGASEMVHSIRATFDALAAGQSPFRVFLTQAPQIAQSLLLIGGRFAIIAGSVAAAAAATVGLGLAINMVVNYYYGAAERAAELIELNRRFWHQVRDQAESDKKSALDADAQKISSQQRFQSEVEKNVDLEAELNKQKAIGEALDQKKLGNAVDEFDLRKKLAMIDKEAAQQKLKNVQDEMNSKGIGSAERQKLRADIVGEKEDAKSKVDALNEKLKDPKLNELGRQAIRAQIFSIQTASKNRVDSFNQQIEDNFKLSYQEGLARIRGLNERIQSDENAIKQAGIDQQESLKKQTQMHVSRGNVTELQRIGAYIPNSTVTIIDLNRKMENHLRNIDNKLGKSEKRESKTPARRMSTPRF
jgi:hypothetical protein